MVLDDERKYSIHAVSMRPRYQSPHSLMNDGQYVCALLTLRLNDWSCPHASAPKAPANEGVGFTWPVWFGRPLAPFGTSLILAEEFR